MTKNIIDFILSHSGLHEYIPKGEKFKKLSDEGSEIYDKIRAALKGELLNDFEKFADLDTERSCEENAEYFIAGVKFGVQFLIECID